jgi:putative Mn2+ efflux pump MntP
MGFLTILIVAVGLAMDAFTVSIAAGIKLGCVTGRQSFRMAFAFGFFQFMMPIIGWVAGYAVEDYIGAFDHWVAFALLSFIGGKMIYECFETEAVPSFRGDPTKGLTLLALAVATSIDAFAVGLSFGVLHQGILYPSIVIGIIAALFSVVGLEAGCRIGTFLNRKMEFIGGIILIIIGVKIVLDHTVFAS